jgi:benzil reductase ((S)-benzoin forming)
LKKLAIITGTGRGLGKSLALSLINQGYTVFGYSRTNKISSTFFHFNKIDLGDLFQVKKIKLPCFDKDLEEVVLINNAATIGKILPITLKSQDDIIYEYNLNIIAPSLICSNFISSYTNSKKIIINISSGAANHQIASWNNYCASKSALDMFTKVLEEEKHKNLKIFSVYPGVVDTTMQKDIRQANPKFFPLLKKFLTYKKENKLENPEIVAKKILYIIKNSHKISKNIVSVRDIHLN